MTSLSLGFIDDIKLFGDHDYDFHKLIPFKGRYDVTTNLMGRFKCQETCSGIINVRVKDSLFNGILVKDIKNIIICTSFTQANEENNSMLPGPTNSLHIYDNPLDDSSLVIELFTEHKINHVV